MRRYPLWFFLALLLALSATASAGASEKSSGLYSVDLTTGLASRIGVIGDGTPIVGLAVSAAIRNHPRLSCGGRRSRLLFWPGRCHDFE